MTWLNENTDGWKVQGSPEWLESRRNYLGASECAAVLGFNPHKTAQHVWEEKLGLREPEKENFHMARGKEMEPYLVQEALKLLSGMREKSSLGGGPDVEVSKEYPFLRASYDYISREGDFVIEVKAPQKHYWEVPKMYWVQVQIQLLISGVMWGFFYARGEEGICYQLYTLDNDFIKDALPKLQRFWDHVVNKTPLIETAEAQIENAEYEAMLDELFEKEAQYKELGTRIDAIRSEIRSALYADETKIGPYVIRIQERKGAVSYDKIDALKSVDLESFRKPPVKVMKVERI